MNENSTTVLSMFEPEIFLIRFHNGVLLTVMFNRKNGNNSGLIPNLNSLIVMVFLFRSN
jgi:hypothetical protein